MELLQRERKLFEDYQPFRLFFVIVLRLSIQTPEILYLQEYDQYGLHLFRWPDVEEHRAKVAACFEAT